VITSLTSIRVLQFYRVQFWFHFIFWKYSYNKQREKSSTGKTVAKNFQHAEYFIYYQVLCHVSANFVEQLFKTYKWLQFDANWIRFCSSSWKFSAVMSWRCAGLLRQLALVASCGELVRRYLRNARLTKLSPKPLLGQGSAGPVAHLTARGPRNTAEQLLNHKFCGHPCDYQWTTWFS